MASPHGDSARVRPLAAPWRAPSSAKFWEEIIEALRVFDKTGSGKITIKEIAETVVLPIWKETCNNVDPSCTETWNETAGDAAGLTIN